MQSKRVITLKAVSVAATRSSPAVHQMCIFIEATWAIPHDNLCGLSSYVTAALHRRLWSGFSRFRSSWTLEEKLSLRIFLLKHAHCSVSLNNRRGSWEIAFFPEVLKQSLLDSWGPLVTCIHPNLRLTVWFGLLLSIISVAPFPSGGVRMQSV